MVNKKIKIDVTDKTCPGPLVEVRKALNKASPGDIVEVTGKHSVSKKEIPMVAEGMGLEIIDTQEKDGKWKIKIQK
jgi:TusA-related sulfurtransferase